MSTSEQARADAMADAETLRLLHDFEPWSAECNFETRCRLVDRKPTLPCCHLRDALAWASIGRLQLSLGTCTGDSHEEAAHAAFKAVPGLRGLT